MKKFLIIGLVVGVVALSITAVYAFGPHFGAGTFAGGDCMGYTNPNLTTEQKAKFAEFQKETLELRQKMLAKHSELATLKSQATPDLKAIAEKKKEIIDLRTQLQKKAVDAGIAGTDTGEWNCPMGGPHGRGGMGMMSGSQGMGPRGMGMRGF